MTTGRRFGAGTTSGGDRHVAAYLAELDISAFDPKAPPPKTPAFWDIVDANRAPEDAELADVLDEMGNPDAVTLDPRSRTRRPAISSSGSRTARTAAPSRTGWKSAAMSRSATTPPRRAVGHQWHPPSGLRQKLH